MGFPRFGGVRLTSLPIDPTFRAEPIRFPSQDTRVPRGCAMSRSAFLMLLVLPLWLATDTSLTADKAASSTASASAALGVPATEADCEDGFDDDFDGCTDAADSDCGGTDTTCDDTDDDCDGVADDDAEFSTWYADADGDGYGDERSNVVACAQPVGYVSGAGDCADANYYCNADCTDGDKDGYCVTTDCNDADGAIYPTADEACNSVDDDCDGSIDEENPGGGAVCDTGLPESCAAGTEQCVGGAIQCVVDAASIPEDCNGVDDDCDGSIDEDNPGGGGECDTGLLGVCGYGLLECSGGQLACTQQAEPTPESCDGDDNDCDGFADEGWDEKCSLTFVYSVDFGPATLPPQYGFSRDWGGPFDPVVGHGWLIPPTSHLPQRERTCEVEERERTLVFAGAERTWELDLFGVLPKREEFGESYAFAAPMDFEVAVTVGDCSFWQFSQSVSVEGVPFVEDETTAPGQFIRRSGTVRVPDGRLSVTIGGGPANTVINSIEVSPAELQPEAFTRVNFQPAVAVPPGFAADYGDVYDSSRGYGWDYYRGNETRARGRNADPLLDSLIFANAPAVWESQLPDGLYDVWAAVGDAAWGQGPHRVVIEGETILDGDTTAANEFIRLHTVSLVRDGHLTLEIGGGGGKTTLNYVAAAEVRPTSHHVNFQPEASQVPDGYAPDWGAPFDAERGYGWTHSLTSHTRERDLEPDQRKDTLIFVGATAESWEVVLPDGDYQVHVSVGDARWAQGPHVVTVEGASFFAGETTPAGQFLEATQLVTVRDGRLSVEVGGGPAGFTTIDYIDVERVDELVSINFQPESSPVPSGYSADSGRAYDPERRYGWEDDFLFQAGRFRDRGVLGIPILDTLVFVGSPARGWRHDLPSGDYRVTLAVGDALFDQGPQRVVVEGTEIVSDESTAAGEFLTVSVCVTVADGQLDLEVGGTAANTAINYLTVRGATCPENRRLSSSIRAPQPVADRSRAELRDLRPLD